MHTILINNGLYEKFAIVRHAYIESSGLFKDVALGIAAALSAFTLIKMAYDLMSDEQGHGLGGVSLKQFLHPLIIMSLILGYPTVVGAIDDIMNAVSISMSTRNTGIEEPFDEALEARTKQNELYTPSFFRGKKKIANEAWERTQKHIADSLNKGNSLTEDDKQFWAESHGQKSWDEYKAAWFSGFTDYLASYNSNSVSRMFSAENGYGFKLYNCGLVYLLWALFSWLYDIIFALIISVGEVTLCLYAFLGCFSLAFGIIDKWKNAPIKMFSKYVEISMWKVTAALLNTIGNSVLRAYNIGIKDVSLDCISQMEAGELPNSMGALDGNIMVVNLIRLAVIIAALRVPKITHEILSIAEAGEDTGNRTENVIVETTTSTVKEGARMAAGAASGGVSSAGSVIGRTINH